MSSTPIRRAALLVPAAALAALAVPAPAAATAPTAEQGLVRLTHLSPETARVDVALTPLSSPEPVSFEDVGYGEVSDYRNVPAGRYALSVRPDGVAEALPELARTVEVSAGGAVTVAVRGAADDVEAVVLEDDLTPPSPGTARVRLLQGARTAGELDVTTTQGRTVAQDVPFGSATGYAEVPAGAWELQLQPSGSGTASATTAAVDLAAGSVQTVLALEQGRGLTTTLVVDAQGVGTMPVGGVQTGFGAQEREGLPVGAAALAGAGLLSVVAVRRVLVGPRAAGRHAAR